MAQKLIACSQNIRTHLSIWYFHAKIWTLYHFSIHPIFIGSISRSHLASLSLTFRQPETSKLLALLLIVLGLSAHPSCLRMFKIVHCRNAWSICVTWCFQFGCSLEAFRKSAFWPLGFFGQRGCASGHWTDHSLWNFKAHLDLLLKWWRSRSWWQSCPWLYLMDRLIWIDLQK